MTKPNIPALSNVLNDLQKTAQNTSNPDGGYHYCGSVVYENGPYVVGAGREDQ
jgi:hypothetical protein